MAQSLARPRHQCAESRRGRDRHTQAHLRSFSHEAGDKTPLIRGKKAADLLRKTFDPPKEIIPGLLFEGLTALVGKPKVGKSRLLLAIAVAITRGGKVLGLHSGRSRGRALYQLGGPRAEATEAYS